LGETAEDETKKAKIRRPKAERIRGEKKRKSAENKSSEEDEGKELEEQQQLQQQQQKKSGKSLVNGLQDFKHNFNLTSAGIRSFIFVIFYMLIRIHIFFKQSKYSDSLLGLGWFGFYHTVFLRHVSLFSAFSTVGTNRIYHAPCVKCGFSLSVGSFFEIQLPN
jgi:hypothetical protein